MVAVRSALSAILFLFGSSFLWFLPHFLRPGTRPDGPMWAVIQVVVNGVRKGPVGGDAESQIRDALRRYVGVDSVVCVPYDRVSFDTALAQGRTLSEVAAKSPARAPLRALAADLMGINMPKQRRRSKARKR